MTNPFWWNRFGPLCARELRRRRAVPIVHYSLWRWHLDKAFVRINGKTHYLRRAVDHEGEVLESYVTKSRDRRAALKFLKKAMRRYGCPITIVTDKLRSYRAAMTGISSSARHLTGRRLNNRVENAYQPFRRRERAMAKFRSMASLQKFSSTHQSIHNHFNHQRHLIDRETFKAKREASLSARRELLGA